MIRQSERAGCPRPDGYEGATAYGFVLASGAWLAGTALLHLAGEQTVAAGATPTGAFTLAAVLWVWLGATMLITALGLGLICGPDRRTATLCLLGVAAAMLHPATERVTWSPASLEARVARIARLPRGAIRDRAARDARAEFRRRDGWLLVAFARGRNSDGRVTADVRDPSGGAALRDAVGQLRMFEGRALRSVRPLGRGWYRCAFGLE
jgi:hypothetical protein